MDNGINQCSLSLLKFHLESINAGGSELVEGDQYEMVGENNSSWGVSISGLAGEAKAHIDWMEQQLAAERERADALAAFAREAFATAFDGGTWDGAGIQEKGAELGLLREEPFDPEKHPGVDASEFEPGETIYVFTELMERSGS